MSHSVLFDARLVLDKPTGIGRYIASLLPEMVRLAPDIHFHLLRRPEPWLGYGLQAWQAPNLTHHLSTEPHMTLRQHWYLPNLAQQLKVGLIHYPHFDAPVMVGGVPVVATLYDAKYLVHPEFFTRLSLPKQLYMRFCFTQTLSRAAAALCISQTTATDLRLMFGTAEKRLHVTPLAADPQFQPAEAQAVSHFRRRYGLRHPFLLSVGEQRPHKNHAGLIQAYAASQSRNTHELVIIGQAHQGYDEPHRLVEQLGLSGRVFFLSDVDAAHLVAAYSAADLFLLVSFYEGFGLPILEAMACGTPVIASRTTATGEVVGAGGVQVDPYNPPSIALAIDRITQDPARHRSLVEQGTRWLRLFTWQRTAEQTIAAYRAVLGERVRR